MFFFLAKGRDNDFSNNRPQNPSHCRAPNVACILCVIVFRGIAINVRTLPSGEKQLPFQEHDEGTLRLFLTT
jgi:hypothetical protein